MSKIIVAISSKKAVSVHLWFREIVEDERTFFFSFSPDQPILPLKQDLHTSWQCQVNLTSILSKKSSLSM